MTLSETMEKLEAAGTAQNRKVYARHGARERMFGVSYAELGKLTRQLKGDQVLAEKLWATGNHDAAILATMIGDVDSVSARTVDTWVKDIDSYAVADALAGFVAQTRYGVKHMEKWIRARNEWTSCTGYNVLARLVENPDVSDRDLTAHLDEIEKGIHDAPNRTRYSMNTALIAIGCRPSLTSSAITAARRVGKVVVDHGETSCKTPDAVPYIEKVLDHRKVMADRAAAKKKKAKKKVATNRATRRKSAAG